MGFKGGVTDSSNKSDLLQIFLTISTIEYQGCSIICLDEYTWNPLFLVLSILFKSSISTSTGIPATLVIILLAMYEEINILE